MRRFVASLLAPGPRPVILNTLEVPSSLRVGVLAPHPDDFDAIGVTMRRLHERGCRIDLAVVTSGASGVEDGFGGAHTSEEKRALRETEQRASCRHFGLPDNRLAFLHLVEDAASHPTDDPANIARVAAWLGECAPDIVFLPHPNDPNQGHRLTYAFFKRACAQSGLAPVACLNRDPKTIAMRPDLCTVFGAADAEWKGGLLRLHASQQARNLRTRGTGVDERLLSLNQRMAVEIGRAGEWSEQFEIEVVGAPPSA